MFKVKIYTIGKVKESWLQEALIEYEKRLSHQVHIEWLLFKNEEELSKKAIAPWIALDVKGELVDSVALSKKLIKLFEVQGKKLHFLIGGAEGIEPRLLQQSIWRWSLSPLTFTHQMARLLLLEQLYRAFEIDSGSAYHK